MNVGAAYPWIKAIHVAATIVFIGGMLVVAVFLASRPDAVGASAPAARIVRRWDETVTTPAMLLVWALGLTLAASGGWFVEAWLQAKLIVVLVLSGLHGIQSGQLRRVGGGGAGGNRLIPPLVVGCTVIIVVLVVVKPWP